MVSQIGLEPIRCTTPADFKSAAAAITPLRERKNLLLCDLPWPCEAGNFSKRLRADFVVLLRFLENSFLFSLSLCTFGSTNNSDRFVFVHDLVYYVLFRSQRENVFFYFAGST